MHDWTIEDEIAEQETIDRVTDLEIETRNSPERLMDEFYGVYGNEEEQDD